MQASFHFPLHRYLAAFVCQAVTKMGISLNDVLPSRPYLLPLLMIHPLRVQVSLPPSYQYKSTTSYSVLWVLRFRFSLFVFFFMAKFQYNFSYILSCPILRLLRFVLLRSHLDYATVIASVY